MKREIQKLYQKLPEQYSIYPQQVRSSYQNLYDKLNESYHEKDFLRLSNLLNSTISSQFLSFKLPNIEKDTLMLDIVNLIYSIITIYPVKDYKAQLLAVSFLHLFLKTHKEIPDLVLNWQPFYKVMKYYTSKMESCFLCGEIVVHMEIQNAPRHINHFYYLSESISKYFPEFDTTEQLVKKFIPKISPNGIKAKLSIRYFCFLCPPHKGKYKLFIDFLLLELRDTSLDENAKTILYLIDRIIKCNIEDDFSFLLPTISEFISTQIYTNTVVNYQNYSIENSFFDDQISDLNYSEILANIVTSLFISPPTRKATIDLLESILISFKSISHPSVSSDETSPVDYFSYFLVLALKSGLKKLTKSDNDRKIFFNMKKELGPTQEELHKFLSLTSEHRIMNIRNGANTFVILIETQLDPSTIDHYFEIAYQCINLMDTEENVSINGWCIMSSLLMSIEKSEKLRENIEQIIEIAANNLYRVNLQTYIANFLNVLFSKVSFNKKTTLKGLEHINFPRLASLIISNLVSIYRYLPKANDDENNDECTEISEDTLELINSFLNWLFKYCDDEVKDELVNIFVSFATDEDISQNYEEFSHLILDFTLNCNLKQAETISEAFKKQIELKRFNSQMFTYLAHVYGFCLPTNLKTIESLRQVADVLLPFTKDENKKIRMAAWDAIISSIQLTNTIADYKVELKPERMKEYPFENAKFEDYEITWNSLPDSSSLMLELFDPIFDKLLTMTDPHEINEILKEIAKPFSSYLGNNNYFSEGSFGDEIEEFYRDPVYNIPSFYIKTYPIKDKFIKCALRILKDFSDHDILICTVTKICSNLFLNLAPEPNTINNSDSSFHYYFTPFDDSSAFYNKVVVTDILHTIYKNRINHQMIHITDDLRELITIIVELLLSNYESIVEVSYSTLIYLEPYYKPLLNSIFANIISKITSDKMESFANFLQVVSAVNYQTIINEELACKILNIALSFDFQEKKKLQSFNQFFGLFCVSMLPSNSPKANKKEYVDLLNEVDKNYLNKNPNNRTYNNFLIHIIFKCLKHVYEVSDNVVEYVMKCITQFDEKISQLAETCLSCILNRRAKITKTKVNVTKYPNISSFPNLLNKVSVKFPENGIYFPLNLKVKNNQKEELIEEEEEEEEEEAEIQTEDTDTNEDIKRIFESFENIEIEFESDTNDEIYDSEFLIDRSNGFFMFQDHYYNHKIEYINDQFLIQNIENLLVSALNSFDEKEKSNNINYQKLWSNYSILIGPYSTKEIQRVCIKFISEFYSSNSIVVSSVLIGLISAYAAQASYWKKEDKIDFIKRVALPVFCIFSSNPTIADSAQIIITASNFYNSPNYFALFLKVLYCLSSEKPGLPFYSRSLISNFSNQIKMMPFRFFSSIDVFIDKYFNSFMCNLSEYSLNEVENMMKLFFCLFSSCSFLDKKSPLYSNEIELKMNSVLNVFDKFLSLKIEDDNSNLKKNFIHALSFSLVFFEISSYDTCISIFPLFMKHIHKILSLLNSTNVNEEELFLASTGLLIESRIFYTNTEIELNFISLLIKEMMNMSLPMQVALLKNVDNVIERNIFNIPNTDYPKYEEILLNYENFAQMKNLGNELRLMIAKILGIFEIRKNGADLYDSCNESADDDVMIAASIILNSFLFDQGDERVTKAFNLMSEKCSSKNSANYEFFKSVSKRFTWRHVDHVLNEVEDLIIQCLGSFAPSYIC